jgi:hypothetical protein
MVVVHAMYLQTCAGCFQSMPCSALSCRCLNFLESIRGNKMCTIADG